MTAATATRPGAIVLRPYQEAAVGAALDAFESGQRGALLAMATGTGKTAIAVALAGRFRRRTLFVCHRAELIEQAESAFRRAFPGLALGVVKAGRDEWRETADGRRPSVTIASVQSLHRGRLEAIPVGWFGLLAVDECHHLAADTWRAVVDHFPGANVLGLSATPTRHDGKGLADVFGPEPVFSYGIREAITAGHLVRIKQYAISTHTDIHHVGRRGGDFLPGELARAVNSEGRNKVITDAFLRLAPGRRALAFCVDLEHVRALTEAFQAAGVRAESVDGAMRADDRKAVFERFSRGETRVLVNCQIATEGFDDPHVDCLLMARPTLSRPLYTQMVGRALRLAEGKVDALVLDFTDNATKHKLISVCSLLGAVQVVDAAGGDVLEVVDRDRAEAEADRRIATQRPLSWRVKAVSPWPTLPDLAGYVATRAWQNARASEKQTRLLKSFGLEIGRKLTKGEACYLIDRALTLEASHPTPPTPAQRWRLEREGLWRDGMTKREAGRILARWFRENPQGVEKISAGKTT